MPAVTVDDLLVLPQITIPGPATRARPVGRVVTAPPQLEEPDSRCVVPSPVRSPRCRLTPSSCSTVRAAARITGGHGALDVLVLGGLPIREPIVAYGPLMMYDRGEINPALGDYRSGRLGTTPAGHAAPRRFAL